MLGAGCRELVPEQRLQAVERDAVVGEEAHLRIRSLYVLLMVAVDEQHIVGRELDAGEFAAQDGHEQLDAYALVLAHAELSGHRYLLAARLQREVATGEYVRCGGVVVGNALHELQRLLLSRLLGLCVWQRGQFCAVGDGLLART